METDPRADAYRADVLAGRIVVGRLVRLAVQRAERDRERAASRGLRRNERRATAAVWWIEHRIRFSHGEWAGQPYKLEPWQCFMVSELFGWDKRVGDRWIRRFPGFI